jgi:hypothetical protein
MKPCSVCGDLKPDEEFTVDVSREDGLAIRCRDCNKAKCRAWYLENKARKTETTLAYRAAHGRAPQPGAERERRVRAAVRQREAEEPLSEYRLVKLSPSEERFCLEMGERLGLKPDEYIRYLVKDAKFDEERTTEKI